MDHLTFKKFIEKYDCLDRFRAQQRYCNILNKYFNRKNIQHVRVNAEYKTWVASADYQRYWNERTELGIRLKTTTACTEYVGYVTEERLKSLQASSSTKVEQHSKGNNIEGISLDTDLNDSNISNGSDSIECNSIIDNPWLFHDNNNISCLFKNYQLIVGSLIKQHETLPIETYLNELAALTHILILKKSQHSPIAVSAFSASLMDQLAASLCSKTMNYDLNFDDHQYLTLTKYITDLSLSKTSRQQVMLDMMIMRTDMDYNQKCVICAIMNL